MLSPITSAPAAVPSPLNLRGLKKNLLEITSSPSFSEYRSSEAPSVTFTRDLCASALSACSDIQLSISKIQVDIDTITAAGNDDAQNAKLLKTRLSDLRSASEDLIRQTNVYAGMMKTRQAEMTEVERYAKLCSLVLPALGTFKDQLLMSSTLGTESNQTSIKMLFSRLDTAIANLEPSSTATVMSQLTALAAANRIPGLYQDISTRFQKFFVEFNALRDPYADAPIIDVVRIDTRDQRADQFTKTLSPGDHAHATAINLNLPK